MEIIKEILIGNNTIAELDLSDNNFGKSIESMQILSEAIENK